MEQKAPRLILAGTNSGCGKTTVTCAVLQALVNRKMRVGAFKCGPDYIDPMFHSRVIGAKSANLDLFFFTKNTLNYLLIRNSADCDVNIIEGVMGYYDGMGVISTRASTYEIAQATGSPVVLVVSAKGAALSILASIQGFLSLYPDNHICGVILNQCSAMSYPALAKAITEHFEGRVRPFGYLPKLPECAIESRHLGLVTAAEIANLKEKLELLAQNAEKTLDLDGLLELARSAAPVSCDPVEIPQFDIPVRIAVAKDRAFCFYYEDNLQLLKDMGAELVEFSPLSDPALPEKIDGIYLGGGYPELYAEQLSKNHSMLASLQNALSRGTPCIAECGGFMYLTGKIAGYPMVGYLKGECFDTGKLTRFGYVTLRAQKDNLLCKAGDVICGHEFHRWDCNDPGKDFTATKSTGRCWDCVVATDKLYAGYPHFHFYANPDFAKSFYQACLKERELHG